jgi:hypothetical protein
MQIKRILDDGSMVEWRIRRSRVPSDFLSDCLFHLLALHSWPYHMSSPSYQVSTHQVPKEKSRGSRRDRRKRLEEIPYTITPGLSKSYLTVMQPAASPPTVLSNTHPAEPSVLRHNALPLASIHIPNLPLIVSHSADGPEHIFRVILPLDIQ